MFISRALLISSLVLMCALLTAQWFGIPSQILAVFHFMACLAALFAVRDPAAGTLIPQRWTIKKKFSIPLAVALITMLIRVSMPPPEHLHRDEYILGYHALEIDFLKDDLYGGFPKVRGEWLSQSPLPFWAYLKIFLSISGPTPAGLEAAAIPLAGAISLALFILLSMISSTRVAILGTLTHAFLGPAIYFESLTVNNHLSTLFLLWASIAIVYNTRKRSPLSALITGMSIGICFLGYQSSFLSAPLWIASMLLSCSGWKTCSTGISWQRSIMLTLLGAGMLLAPWILSAYMVPSRAFFYWIIQKMTSTDSRLPAGIVSTGTALDYTRLSVLSLFTDGIGGGVDGFTFGRLAFFTPITSFLLTAGIVAAIAGRYRSRDSLLLVLIVVANFVGGVLLTRPPATYHRLMSALPFIAGLLAFGIEICISRIPRKWALQTLWGCLLTGILATSNLAQVRRAFASDMMLSVKNSDEIRLIEFLDRTFPGTPIHLIFFPGFHLKKIYQFHEPARKIHQYWPADAFQHFNPDQPYIWIVVAPYKFPDLVARLQALDPRGRLFTKQSRQYTIFSNIWTGIEG